QPIDDILRAWEETKADAIGMSGLLVKSTLIMRDNLELMNERGINVPVILGGAALNRRYVDADLVPLYNGQLFYARVAFDGLHAMDRLTNADLGLRNADSETPALTLSAAANGNPQSAIEDPQSEEDLVGEDAKLGKAAARVSTRVTGDTTHT